MRSFQYNDPEGQLRLQSTAAAACEELTVVKRRVLRTHPRRFRRGGLSFFAFEIAYSTSFPGGNLTDGLPPALSYARVMLFGPSCDFEVV